MPIASAGIIIGFISACSLSFGFSHHGDGPCSGEGASNDATFFELPFSVTNMFLN
jgi:hypothetical protein